MPPMAAAGVGYGCGRGAKLYPEGQFREEKTGAARNPTALCRVCATCSSDTVGRAGVSTASCQHKLIDKAVEVVASQ